MSRDPAVVIVRGRVEDGSQSRIVTAKVESPDAHPKAQLVMELMRLGVRVPPTIAVEVEIGPSMEMEVAARHVQAVVRCGIDELWRTRRNEQRAPSEPRGVVARWEWDPDDAPGWRPAFVGPDGFREGAPRAESSLERAVASWALDGVDAAATPILRFLLQEHVSSAGRATSKGWLWHDGDSGLRAGVVQQTTGASHLGWSSFREWSQARPGLAGELVAWLGAIHGARPEVPLLRMCFGTAEQTVYGLSLHAQPVSADYRLRHVVEASRQGILPLDRAISSLAPNDLERRGPLSREERSQLKLLARGHDGGGPVVQGRAALSVEDARSLREASDPVVLLTEVLEPRDVAAITSLSGIVSLTGGPSSHAVVVARGLGATTLLGARGLEINGARSQATGRTGATIAVGDWLVVDGVEGALYAGRIEEDDAHDQSAESEVRRWVMERAGSAVRANADRADEVLQAVRMHAPAIGLCRSENHLLDPQVLRVFLRYLLAMPGHRGEALAAVVGALRDQLFDVLRAAGGRWVHYRLLDPRFEELLPSPDTPVSQLATELGLGTDEIADRLARLRRSGGMFGERGCRWGLRSGFYEEQLKAVASAVADVASNSEDSIRLALVVPVVVDSHELAMVRELAEPCFGLSNQQVEVKFGSMIETARAAILASDLARMTDVLCFGTNDLTQSVWSLSRDEGPEVLSYYQATGILDADPFRVVDRGGVGTMVEAALSEIDRGNPLAEKVICGEQAADPESAAYFISAGADAVSCRPSAMARIALAVSKQRIRQEGTFGIARPLKGSRAEAFCEWTCARIRRGLVAGRSEACHEAAFSWAKVVSSFVGLGVPRNWKFFKRDLLARWFGHREHTRFASGWATDDVVTAAQELGQGGRTVRCSVFPDTIACHSVSESLPPGGDAASWRKIIDSLDKSAPLEVFPQQGSNQLCFRAVVSHGRTIVEAGVGQAMYVFEEERGAHPVAIAELTWNGASPPVGPTDAPRRELSDFLDRWGDWLLVRLTAAITTLGTSWLGIEGYHRPGEEHAEPFVCDLDLPPDMAFHAET